MKITRGTWRIVILLPEVGLVIKFPILKIDRAFEGLPSIRRSKNILAGIKEYFSAPMGDGQIASFRYFMFYGIVSNWIEYKFYQKTKNSFLQETYFSLFGLINIQKLGFQLDEKEGFKKWNFRDQIDLLTDKQARRDMHHWFEHKNFCIEGEKLKTFDYGSIKCQKIIEQYGEKVHNSFNFQENLEAKD